MENYIDNFKDNELNLKFLEVSENLPFGTPEYKIKNFVGGAQITPYARIKQYFVELRTRQDAVEKITYLRRIKEIEIELEKQKIEFLTDDLKKELVEITIKDFGIDLRKYDRSYRDAVRERDSMVKLIKEFLDSEDGKLPDGSSFITVFDKPELMDQFEHEHWTVRMAKQAMLDMIAYGRIGTGNLDSILMMEEKQQQEVLALTAHYTLSVDKNINQLMGAAATNDASLLIEDRLKEQLKLGTTQVNTPEKLL